MGRAHAPDGVPRTAPSTWGSLAPALQKKQSDHLVHILIVPLIHCGLPVHGESPRRGDDRGLGGICLHPGSCRVGTLRSALPSTSLLSWRVRVGTCPLFSVSMKVRQPWGLDGLCPKALAPEAGRQRPWDQARPWSRAWLGPLVSGRPAGLPLWGGSGPHTLSL